MVHIALSHKDSLISTLIDGITILRNWTIVEMFGLASFLMEFSHSYGCGVIVGGYMSLSSQYAPLRHCLKAYLVSKYIIWSGIRIGVIFDCIRIASFCCFLFKFDRLFWQWLEIMVAMPEVLIVVVVVVLVVVLATIEVVVAIRDVNGMYTRNFSRTRTWQVCPMLNRHGFGYRYKN